MQKPRRRVNHRKDNLKRMNAIATTTPALGAEGLKTIAKRIHQNATARLATILTHPINYSAFVIDNLERPGECHCEEDQDRIEDRAPHKRHFPIV
jgi:hypothetical protein